MERENTTRSEDRNQDRDRDRDREQELVSYFTNEIHPLSPFPPFMTDSDIQIKEQSNIKNANTLPIEHLPI